MGWEGSQAHGRGSLQPSWPLGWVGSRWRPGTSASSHHCSAGIAGRSAPGSRGGTGVWPMETSHGECSPPRHLTQCGTCCLFSATPPWDPQKPDCFLTTPGEETGKPFCDYYYSFFCSHFRKILEHQSWKDLQTHLGQTSIFIDVQTGAQRGV